MNDLKGKRILITRPQHQADGLCKRLASLGAETILLPSIEIIPIPNNIALEEAIQQIHTYRWVIFTSVNGVRIFWQTLEKHSLEAQSLAALQVAAIGPATAGALQERGVIPNFTPAEYIAEAIVPGLGDIRAAHILLPRAEIARRNLFQELEKAGAIPHEIPVYRTIPARIDRQALAQLEKGLDIATFTSSSTVRFFFEQFGSKATAMLDGALIACIGPITAETARQMGLKVDILAEDYTADGLVDALLDTKIKPH